MDFSVFLQPAFSGGGTYLDWIVSGIKWTLLVSVLAWIIAFTVGSILGVMRTAPLALLRVPATIYVEIFRNIPLLVQMFIWYFVLPEIAPKSAGDWLKTQMPMPELSSAADPVRGTTRWLSWADNWIPCQSTFNSHSACHLASIADFASGWCSIRSFRQTPTSKDRRRGSPCFRESIKGHGPS